MPINASTTAWLILSAADAVAEAADDPSCAATALRRDRRSSRSPSNALISATSAVAAAERPFFVTRLAMSSSPCLEARNLNAARSAGFHPAA
jgi:hypothetical protein